MFWIERKGREAGGKDAGRRRDLVQAQVGTSKKRKRDEQEEEEEVKSTPVLIHRENHTLKDDAHSVFDWEARSLRPYAGDLTLYWSKMTRVSRPIIEDIKMGHMTKSAMNPNIIAKLHDRGAEISGKQWLSSNYSVEGKGGKIRAENDRTAGAFVLDYTEATGVWDAVDAIHNYTIALRFVRPEDYSGQLLLKCLHDVRFFDGAGFSDKKQKTMIMSFFDQVLRTNAMKGRMRKPPMDREEMMAIAKELLFKQGIDGLAPLVTVEPYSAGSRTGSKSGNINSTSDNRSAGSQSIGMKQGKKPEMRYKDMSLEEKVARCCRSFNSSQGCSRVAHKCRFSHLCNVVLAGRVCWSKEHGAPDHK